MKLICMVCVRCLSIRSQCVATGNANMTRPTYFSLTDTLSTSATRLKVREQQQSTGPVCTTGRVSRWLSDFYDLDLSSFRCVWDFGEAVWKLSSDSPVCIKLDVYLYSMYCITFAFQRTGYLCSYTLCSEKHPLTFSFISPWMMCGFKQKLQWIYAKKGRF